MSCIASYANRVSASGRTCRNVRPAAVTLDTPSVVSSRYSVRSGPVGSSSLNWNSGMGSA